MQIEDRDGGYFLNVPLGRVLVTGKPWLHNLRRGINVL
jgi:hypothetical protein